MKSIQTHQSNSNVHLLQRSSPREIRKVVHVDNESFGVVTNISG